MSDNDVIYSKPCSESLQWNQCLARVVLAASWCRSCQPEQLIHVLCIGHR
jgi:hypothetical protein